MIAETAMLEATTVVAMKVLMAAVMIMKMLITVAMIILKIIDAMIMLKVMTVDSQKNFCDSRFNDACIKGGDDCDDDCCGNNGGGDGYGDNYSGEELIYHEF